MEFDYIPTPGRPCCMQRGEVPQSRGGNKTTGAKENDSEQNHKSETQGANDCAEANSLMFMTTEQNKTKPQNGGNRCTKKKH